MLQTQMTRLISRLYTHLVRGAEPRRKLQPSRTATFGVSAGALLTGGDGGPRIRLPRPRGERDQVFSATWQRMGGHGMGRPPPALQGPGRGSTLSPRPSLSGLLVKQRFFQTQTCHPSTWGHRRRCSLGPERVSAIPSNVPFCSQPKRPSSGDPSPSSQSRDVSFLTCLLRTSSFALERESPFGIPCSLSGFPTFRPGSHVRPSFVNAETVGPSGCFIAEAALQTRQATFPGLQAGLRRGPEEVEAARASVHRWGPSEWPPDALLPATPWGWWPHHAPERQGPIWAPRLLPPTVTKSCQFAFQVFYTSINTVCL